MDEEIRRLMQRLAAIRGNDPISRARRAALTLEICKLLQGGAEE